MKYFIYLLILLISLSCDQENDHPKTTNAMESFPEFDLQGHRGARGLMPENTIPSFLKALEYGVTTLELDLVVSADNQLIISHEPWFHHAISTKPNGEPVLPEEARSYNIFAMNYNDIALYDVGLRGHALFPEQQPMAVSKPTLRKAVIQIEEYISAAGLKPVFYNIETKSVPEEYGVYYPAPQKFARLLYDELNELNILDRIFIQSFDVNTLIAMKEIDTNVPLVLLVGNRNGLDWNLDQLGFIPDIYSPNFNLIDSELVQRVQSMGMKIVPWTINQLDDMISIVEMGVDGIITDYPNRAIEIKMIREKMGLD